MRITKLTLWILIIILTACDSEVISPSLLLVKEIEDPTSYTDHFTYQDRQLLTFKTIFGSREETSIKFIYSDNKLIRIENVRDQGLESNIELTYNEKGQRDKETLTMVHNGVTTYIRTGMFTYNNEELKSVIYTYNKPDYSMEEREFHWSKGNLTKIDFYYYFNGQRFPSITRLYTYDSQLNYSNQDIAFIYTVGTGDETKFSKNNLVSMQEISGTDIYQGGQYSFTYNENGYPVKYVYKLGGQEFAPIQIRYY
jgi:hypothetical protein